MRLHCTLPRNCSGRCVRVQAWILAVVALAPPPRPAGQRRLVARCMRGVGRILQVVPEPPSPRHASRLQTLLLDAAVECYSSVLAMIIVHQAEQCFETAMFVPLHGMLSEGATELLALLNWGTPRMLRAFVRVGGARLLRGIRDFGDSCWSIAACRGDVTVFHALVELLRPSPEELLVGGSGFTPLHNVMRRIQVERFYADRRRPLALRMCGAPRRTCRAPMVLALLEAGCGVNAVSHDGTSALGLALRARRPTLEEDNTDVVRILLDHGADLHSVDGAHILQGLTSISDDLAPALQLVLERSTAADITAAVAEAIIRAARGPLTFIAGLCVLAACTTREDTSVVLSTTIRRSPFATMVCWWRYLEGMPPGDRLDDECVALLRDVVGALERHELCGIDNMEAVHSAAGMMGYKDAWEACWHTDWTRRVLPPRYWAHDASPPDALRRPLSLFAWIRRSTAVRAREQAQQRRRRADPRMPEASDTKED